MRELVSVIAGVVISLLGAPASQAATAIAVANDRVYSIDLETGDHQEGTLLSTPSPDFFCRDLARYDELTYFCAVGGDLFRLDLASSTIAAVTAIPDTETSGVARAPNGDLWFLRRPAVGMPGLLALDPTTGAVLSEVELSLPTGTAEAISVLNGDPLVVGLDPLANVAWLSEVDPITGSTVETQTYDPYVEGDEIFDLDTTRIEGNVLWVMEWHVTGVITAQPWPVIRRVTLEPFDVVETWNGTSSFPNPPLLGIDIALGPVAEIPALGGSGWLLLALFLSLTGILAVRRMPRRLALETGESDGSAGAASGSADDNSRPSS